MWHYIENIELLGHKDGALAACPYYSIKDSNGSIITHIGMQTYPCLFISIVRNLRFNN